ncbi:coiled-coil domain-containing protein [Oopsacas minuta]|uniref:Coiled-coil domain-containing protein n=1 Tax=Oopsacas minuta TaxID=111878 RepID=A0AAV7K9X2_9METZ|nr:coiled-coil domain-containing protein [Oopsacas minuta]
MVHRLIVSREISRLIQLNHNDYMEEVTRLVNIQSSLQKACNLSLQSRSQLQISLQGIKDGGLGILLSFRRMERLRSSLKQLSLVKTLHRADLWLKERLNTGHYKEAAHCCMIFLRALNSFHNYSCCIDLSSKLLDIQQVITSKLDANLVDLCENFEPGKYLNLMAAYTLLGKGEAAIDKLALNYVSQIKVLSKEVLRTHYGKLPDEYFQDTIRVISLDYFNHYHELRMEDLKLFIENESWELCPLPINFSLGQFTEFSFLSNSNSDSIAFDFDVQFDISNLQSRKSLLNFFHQSGPDSTASQDPLSIDYSIVNETSDSYINNSTYILTANTTLITLKYIGRYIQFMISLPSIALELFHFICQMYKYYFFVTNIYFADLRSFHFEHSIIEIHGMEVHENYYSTKLNTVLSEIESETNLQKQCLIPNFSIFHQLLSEDNIMFGLKQRIVGVESLLFLSEQLSKLKPTFESYFSRNTMLSSLDYVSSFYSQCIEISYGLRRPVYCGIARYAINYEQVFIN